MSSARTTDQPLIVDSRPVWGVVAVSVLVVVVLAAVVWRGTTTAFDTWAFRRAYVDFPAPGSLGRRFWLWFSAPALSLAVPAVIAVWAGVRKRWNVAALAVVGPALALCLTELVGKPLIGRLIGPGIPQGSTLGALTGSFPSGHETARVSWLVLALVLLFRAPLTQRLRGIGLGVAIVWAVVAAMGLTVNYYHYATDTIAAIGLATATVLAVALAIDKWCATLTARLLS